MDKQNVGRIKCLMYMILALVLVLYAAVIAFTIVIVVPKEQDGVWSNWESWSKCSESCGGGLMSRNRTCSNPAPIWPEKKCFGNFEQVELCNKQPCPGTDGSWANLENWGMCSDSCGGGIMSRNRTCSNPAPVGLGKQCIGNFEQVELCNKQPCPGIDGGWTVWESWGSCSRSCGVGVRFRSRSCTNPSPSLTGRTCTGDFTDVSICNRKTCPGHNVALPVLVPFTWTRMILLMFMEFLTILTFL